MKLPSGSTLTTPLAVLVEPLNVKASPSGSVNVATPLTKPLTGSGAPATAVPAGAVLAGLIATVTGTSSTPPWESVTVRVKPSCRSAAVAVSAAA